MAADAGRLVTLFGLEVTDDTSYMRYREGMAPILARYGGAFGCDFSVARVLLGPSPRINRVFTIAFPDRETRERFFADEDYLAVRARWFTPSVRTVEILEEAVTSAREP
jgi:uncharacterized protein (DUF1330 family)